MDTIQILTYNGNEKALKGKNIKLSPLFNPESFDVYSINVIFLSNEIWKNRNNITSSIDCLQDLKNIGEMIKRTDKTKIVIILPQNGSFFYKYDYYEKSYQNERQLKNMPNEMMEILSSMLIDFKYIRIFYENTLTKIGQNELVSNFCFDAGDNQEVLTKSIKSNKITTIKRKKIIYTTLGLKDETQIIEFLKEVNLLSQKEERPDWIRSVDMFDDKKLKKSIDNSKEIIKTEEHKMQASMLGLEKNNHYKSILYSQGQELVDVIFEIFKEMLGFDLSNFNDKKEEDFLFETEQVSYIGEIKGVTSNVKSSNVSQLDVHYHKYIEVHPDKKDKTIALLVMNHQRNKPIKDREQVHEEQINLAKRNGSLILDTYTLLRMFEEYKLGKITRDECLKLLSSKKGILVEDDFDNSIDEKI